MQRRRFFSTAVGLFFTVIAVVSPVFGGSYLDRSALLLVQSEQDAAWMRSHLADKKLGKLLFELAEARANAAEGMEVPKEVIAAHPHLLLMLGAYEKAMEAASEGNAGRFLERKGQAEKEAEYFRSIIKQLGWVMPDPG